MPLPPCSPERNPAQLNGDLIKDRIGNILWENLDGLQRAPGEELRPIHETARQVRRLDFTRVVGLPGTG